MKRDDYIVCECNDTENMSPNISSNSEHFASDVKIVDSSTYINSFQVKSEISM